MNTKGTLLLLVVAAAVFAAIYYQQQKEEQTYFSAAIPVQSIPAVTSSTMERVIVDAPDQEAVTLSKSGDKWYTNVERKHEADANAVRAVTTAFEKQINATVVSSNPDSYAEYAVTDTSSTKVKVFETGKASPTLDLLIGKDGQSAFSTYVRMAGAKDVLNAQASLAMAFKRPDGWRDRQIFNFSGSSTTRIEESGTSATFLVTKAGADKWMFEGPEAGEAESARITSLANMLASLQAEKFIDSSTSQNLANFALEPPRQTIAVTYDDRTTSPGTSTTVTLLVGNQAPSSGTVQLEAGTDLTGKSNDGWYAKRADKEDIFIIGSHAADALTPDPQSMKAPAPASTEPAAEETTGPETSQSSIAETTATLSATVTTETFPMAIVTPTTESAPATTTTAPSDTITTAP